jgi:probable rRNA maturation factor
MGAVRFFSEVPGFKLNNQRKTAEWIKKVLLMEEKTLSSINVIFCSDAYLSEINQQYLKHDTYTDIITFDLSLTQDAIEGEIYISIDRVKENAQAFGSDFDTELCRVIIHGVLHLSGYNDKTSREKSAMRKKEDASLSLRST